MERKQGSISVIINDDQRLISSESIRVAWCQLAPEVIAKMPKYMVVCIQTEEESKSSLYRQTNGRRFVCEVKKGFDFVSVTRAGKHRVMVIAVHGDGNANLALRIANNYLDGISSFNKSIDWDDPEFDDYVIAGYGTSNWFEVPKELFAEKPKTGWRAWLWKFANYGFKKEPVNTCDYRKRVFQFIWWLQPLKFLGLALAILIAFLYTTILKLGWMFIGFKPVSFKEGIEKFLEVQPHPYNFMDEDDYRYWGGGKSIPVTPLEIVLFLVYPVFIYLHGGSGLDVLKEFSVFPVFGLILLLLTSAITIVVWHNRFIKKGHLRRLSKIWDKYWRDRIKKHNACSN